MSRIEGLLKSSHAYFKHSPKRHLEFVKLAKLMETKGLKLLKNVKTRWVSLIEPLRCILQEYIVLLAKMKVDNVLKEKSAKVKCLFIFSFSFSCFFFAIWFMLVGLRLQFGSCLWFILVGSRCRVHVG